MKCLFNPLIKRLALTGCSIALSVGVMFASMTGQAQAQANSLPLPQQSQSRPLVAAVSANEMASLFSSLGFVSTFSSLTATSVQLEVAPQGKPDAGAVYIMLRKCNGATQTAQCSLVQPYGLFPAQSVTPQQLNVLNLKHTKVSVVGIMNAQFGIVGTKIYLNEGVTPHHIAFLLGLFFGDLERIMGALQPVAGTNVSMDLSKETLSDGALGFLGLEGGLDTNLVVNPIGSSGISKFNVSYGQLEQTALENLTHIVPSQAP